MKFLELTVPLLTWFTAVLLTFPPLAGLVRLCLWLKERDPSDAADLLRQDTAATGCAVSGWLSAVVLFLTQKMLFYPTWFFFNRTLQISAGLFALLSLASVAVGYAIAWIDSAANSKYAFSLRRIARVQLVLVVLLCMSAWIFSIL